MASGRGPERGPEREAGQRRPVPAVSEVAVEHEPGRERARRILDERARALARPITPPAWGATIEVITFALGNETYALESRYLQGVFQLQELSLIGGAPPIFGVTVWRGELLTILDLRRLLGVPAAALSDLSRVLVLGEARAAFGILADDVVELVTLPVATIGPPAEGVAAERRYLRGITGEAVLVLDAAKLLQLHSRGGSRELDY